MHDFLLHRQNDLRPQLERLIQEQRSTNRWLQRFWSILFGFVAGLLAMQILIRFYH